MSKPKIVNIKFLDATKQYKRLLQIQLSNHIMVYAGPDKGPFAEVLGDDLNEAEIKTAQEVTQATIDCYKVWLQGGEIR